MPFTPFHLGPGTAFKALGGKHFSFLVFAGSQVLMDIEPLIGIIQGSKMLHGFTHTFPGATMIGFCAALTGKPISQYFLDKLTQTKEKITWPAAIAGAFVGTYSHVLLDAIMHSDLQLFYPFLSIHNPLLRLISVGHLHGLCVVMGMAGLASLILQSQPAAKN